MAVVEKEDVKQRQQFDRHCSDRAFESISDKASSLSLCPVPHWQLSHEERAELLCRVTERFSGLEVHQRPQFLKRRRLEPRYMDLRATELALSTRRSDVSVCCAQVGREGLDTTNSVLELP